MPSSLCPFISLAALAACAGLALAEETVLYETDFSEFEVGDDTLVGNDGWQSSHPDQAVHGTIDDVFEEGNRSGTIGFNIPEGDANVVTLWRPLNVDPIANESLIHFSADVAIIDSDNDAFDSFYFSVFNQEDELLASVVFDNTEDAFGLWRYDSEEFHDLSTSFEHSTIYQLGLTIDFANNQWSADLDDISLFDSAPFTGDATRNLGDVAVEWEITDLEDPGTNWMYFDNWKVTEETVSPDPEPDDETLFAPRIRKMANGNLRLSWDADPGESFIIEHSEDLRTWNSPGNAEITATEEGVARFVDATAAGVEARYYRVRNS